MTIKTVDKYRGFTILEDTAGGGFRYTAEKDHQNAFNLDFQSVDSVKSHIDRVVNHTEKRTKQNDDNA